MEESLPHLSLITLDIESSEWSTCSPETYRFLISTNSSLIQPAAVNEAFAGEAIYWAKPIDETLMKKMLKNSLCLGLYELPESSSTIAGRSNPQQIGLARLITDEVSFAYLTDVYVLEEFQGKGLGTWLIRCVDEILSSWPELRRALLVTSMDASFYGKLLDMKEFKNPTVAIYSRKGPGSVFKDE